MTRLGFHIWVTVQHSGLLFSELTPRCQANDRVNCGYFGIGEGECEDRGCCWSPSSADELPWCYHEKGNTSHSSSMTLGYHWIHLYKQCRTQDLIRLSSTLHIKFMHHMFCNEELKYTYQSINQSMSGMQPAREGELKYLSNRQFRGYSINQPYASKVKYCNNFNCRNCTSCSAVHSVLASFAARNTIWAACMSVDVDLLRNNVFVQQLREHRC